MDVIFLLGAGASREAGYPLMDELSREFPDFLEKKKLADGVELGQLFDQASLKVSSGRTPNIERVITFLEHLAEFKAGNMKGVVRSWRRPFNADSHLVERLLDEIRKYIRERLGKPCDYEAGRYLGAVMDFVEPDRALDVFTLNYDQVFETNCARLNRRFTTGFGEVWDPKLFREPSWDVRIFKLHGSVDWYRVSPAGPIFRGGPEHFAFSGVEAKDVLIYPSFGKATHAEPFATLMELFGRRLDEADFLVAVGYSFQDDHIRRTVLDRMGTNRDLQLLLLDTHPERTIGMQRFQDEPTFSDFSDRVSGLWSKAKYALENRQIRHRIQEILRAENSVNEVVDSVKGRQFQYASTLLLRAFGLCRVTDLWEKPVALVDQVRGEEFTKALESALAGTAGQALTQLKRKVPASIPMNVGGADVAGSPLATLGLVWILCRFKKFESLASAVENQLTAVVTEWLTGWSFEYRGVVMGWPITTPARPVPTNVLEFLRPAGADLEDHPLRSLVDQLSKVDQDKVAVLNEAVPQLSQLWERYTTEPPLAVALRGNQQAFRQPGHGSLVQTATGLTDRLTPFVDTWASPPQELVPGA